MNAFDFYKDLWLPSELVISDIEANGVMLDPQVCEEEYERLAAELHPIEIFLDEWAGRDVNWRSPKQIAQVLYHEKGFTPPPVKGTLKAVQLTSEGEEPTGEASLQYLADHCEDEDDKEALWELLKFKKLSREAMFSRDLPDYMDSAGHIHCGLDPKTETGRLAAKNPNLQQIPSPGDVLREIMGLPEPRVRQAFIASPGHVLLCLDYSGLEWRILAHILAQRYDDYSLVNDIKDGVDPHSATAQRMGQAFPNGIFGPAAAIPIADIKKRFPHLRAIAKILNYSINYGKTGAGLGVQIRDEAGNPIGKDAGQQLIDGFLAANPGIARFHEDITQYGKERGYVRTLLGRYRYIPQLRAKKRWLFNKGRRLALNTPIQGSAADIVTAAMLRCNPVAHPELVNTPWYSAALDQLGARLILQVHDELLFEVPEENAVPAMAVAVQLMENCLVGLRDFKCPLDVDGGIGPNWAAAGGK